MAEVLAMGDRALVQVAGEQLLQEALHLQEAMAEVSAGDGRKALVIGAVGLPWGGLGGDSCGGEQRMSLWRTGAAHGPSAGKWSGLRVPGTWGGSMVGAALLLALP